MIPYFEQPCANVGPLRICAFGVIIAASVAAGLYLGRRRFTEGGLDHTLGESMAWYAILWGFVGAHLFSVFLYFPDEVARDPLLLLRFWEDISSFGGILGGLLGILLFFRRRLPDADWLTRLKYLDVAAVVFPVSLMIGRVACSLAHDHPGTVTRFPLGISLERPEARAYVQTVYENAGRLHELPAESSLAMIGFHDLGWYEFLYLVVVVVPLTLFWSRRTRKPGFHLVTFALLYTPVRFGLDFLRVSDARYAGLTPAQYACVAMFVVAVVTTWRWRGQSAMTHT